MTAAIRLVATDLDGTLLRPDGTVTPRARAALRAALARGLAVVLVTGRPPRGVRRLDLRDCAELAVCANGALLYDLAADRLLDERPIPGAAVTRLVADLRRAAPGVVFAAEYGLLFCREPAYPPGDPLDERDGVVEDALRFAGRGVAKLLVRHPQMAQKLLLPLAAAVAGDDAVVTRSGLELLEISAAGVTKASALARVCDELGIAPAEVAALGDMVNDLSMLRWAGHAVAVANAHPDVLAAAAEVIASNADDGVAGYIERLAGPAA
jgi:Cof subfamily protein (haloacid dehalogenase superfamily)